MNNFSCIRVIQHSNYYKVCISVQLIELLQFLIVRSHGESSMEEEMCRVDSCNTNSILKETIFSDPNSEVRK
jgi:hypothetical protein